MPCSAADPTRREPAHRRVGVMAPGHKAIHNLLTEIEKVARSGGVRFRGLKKSTDNPESQYEGELIKSDEDNAVALIRFESVAASTTRRP